jgi:hypothetical protein
MPLDALTLVSRIIDRAAQKAGQSMGPAAMVLDEDQRLELMVDALAGQLLGFLGASNAPQAASHPDAPSELERLCAEQIERNAVLAGALGACACWGEVPTCPECAGRGTVAWRRPDRAAFDRFVRPVVQRLHQRSAHRQHRPPVGATGTGVRTQ